MSTLQIEIANSAAKNEASTDELPPSPPTPIKVHRQNGQAGIPPELELPPMTHTYDDLNARFKEAKPAPAPAPAPEADAEADADARSALVERYHAALAAQAAGSSTPAQAKPTPTYPPELRRPVLTASVGATNLGPSRNLEAALSAADDRADLKRSASPSSPSSPKRHVPTRALKAATSDL